MSVELAARAPLRPSAARASARSGSASAAMSASRTAATAGAPKQAAAMKGRPGDGALSATTATRSMSSGRPRASSAKLTQSIAARSARPSATASTLPSCEPVTTTARKKGAGPAIGAIVERNRFIPVLLSQPLSAAIEPRNSPSARRGSVTRRITKLRCEVSSQPGNSYSGAAISATASLSQVT